MQKINDVVSVETNDDAALICLDNAPVNAAPQARVGLKVGLPEIHLGLLPGAVELSVPHGYAAFLRPSK